MLSAAFTLAFYGFLRVSEFTSPSHKRLYPHIHPITTDISWSKSHFHYRLKKSKTDQLHWDQTIYLPRSRGPTCPYAAMKMYLKHSRVTNRPYPLFVFSDGTPLNRGSCLKHLRYLPELVIQSCLRMPGVGVGNMSACGAREKKRLNCFLERASASSLLLPTKCFILTVQLF